MKFSRKILIGIFLGVAIVVLSIMTWKWNRIRLDNHDEKIARQYCSSCHVFPEPGLLTKTVWNESVLPEMAFRMGIPDYTILARISPADLPRIQQVIPATPMITAEELQSIRKYYWKNAPTALVIKEQKFEPVKQFKAKAAKFYSPFLTMLKVDKPRGNMFVSTQSSWLFKLDSSLSVKDSFLLKSPASHAVFDNNNTTLSLLGILMPNDQARGSVANVDVALDQSLSLLDSLQRPVFFQKEDMNADGKMDFIVCDYGNYTGDLTIYEMREKGFSKHALARTPGARKVEVYDFNGDGRKDILVLFAQGDERLVLYLNLGDMRFQEKVLMRFPPVYGSNYFEVIDFNKDGYLDILVTNGDNGDYSIILKPYHGIRIFENDKNNNFNETWFFPMPGASQATAEDFDKDGDLDIAAISFFPDFDQHPEQSFIYLENKGPNNYSPQSIMDASNGRWLVMDTWDYDHDGDLDIFLGASSYRGLGANNEIYHHWMKMATPLMVLENTLHP